MTDEKDMQAAWAAINREESAGLETWFYETLARKAIDSLTRNRMQGVYVPNRAEAKAKVMSLIPEGASVSFSDSVTLYQTDIIPTLRKGGYNLIDGWEKGIDIKEAFDRRRRALLCDVYVSGTNALTLDGKLVNVDGLGNRVGALIFGPKKVIVVAGINKLVTDVEEALERVRKFACPMNAKRHGYQSPCTITGICADCRGKWRICNKTAIIEGESLRFFPEPRTMVVIVGERLGL